MHNTIERLINKILMDFNFGKIENFANLDFLIFRNFSISVLCDKNFRKQFDYICRSHIKTWKTNIFGQKKFRFGT